MHGVYTVGGASPDFASLQAITGALVQQGIDSNVVVSIRDGQYAELLFIDSVPGTAANRSITFQSESGDSNAVVINGSTTAQQQNTLFLNNCKYIYFKKLTFFQAPNVNNNAVIKINKGKHCRFENCIIQGHNSVTSSATDWVIQGCNDSGMVVTRCGLYGAVDGLYMGNGALNHRNLEISYCVFSTGGRSVFLDGGIESKLHHNTFNSRLLFQNHRRWEFHHNNVTGTFQLIQSGGLINSPCRFYNNIVSASGGGTAVYTFRSSSSPNIKVNFNTFYINSNTAGFAVYIDGSFSASDEFELTDNIIYRQNADASRYLFYYPNPTSYAAFWHFDRNVYFTNGPNLTYNYGSLQAFRDSLGIETHSVFSNPQFAIPQQGFYPQNDSLSGLSAYNPQIDDDLTGTPRNIFYPSPGALELPLPPQFVDDTLVVNLCVGGLYQLPVPPYRGQAASHVSWMHNQLLLPDSGSQLGIDISNPITNEPYDCIISNEWGTDTSRIFMNVSAYVPVEILAEDSAFCANDSVLLQGISTNADSLVWGNGHSSDSIYVTQSGLYWLQAWQQGFCAARDSVYIQQLPLPDLGVINDGISLNALQTGALYQWIDCSSNLEIPAANHITFAPAQEGNYRVNITLNNCTASSDCEFFGTTGLVQTGKQNSGIRLTRVGERKFICSHIIQDASMLGMDGKILPLKFLHNVIQTGDLSPGIYVLRIQAGGEILQEKIFIR